MQTLEAMLDGMGLDPGASSHSCGQKLQHCNVSGSSREQDGCRLTADRQRAWLPLIASYRKHFMRSLLPQLLVLALSLARADLSSEDPSWDLPKAVWEIEGLTLQRPDSCWFKRQSTTC